jgi:hypothetical protein
MFKARGSIRQDDPSNTLLSGKIPESIFRYFDVGRSVTAAAGL